MFRESLRKAPLLRVVLPFCAGIAYGPKIPVPGNPLPAGLLALLILMAGIAAYAFPAAFRSRWVYGTTITLCLFFTGFLYYGIYKSEIFRELPVVGGSAAGGEVLVQQKVTASYRVYQFRCREQLDGKSLRPVNVLLQLYVPLTADSLSLQPGEYIMVSAAVQRPPLPTNPGEFNYRQYLEHRKIWGTLYARRREDIKVLRPAGTYSFAAIASRLQVKFLSLFRDKGIRDDELAIFGALTIGVRDEIDPGLIQSFSASGAMHVLAVSGLHVGIIYLVIAWLLSFMQRVPVLRRAGALLQVILLWFYAFITGLSPAVNRSAAMFSFLAMGKSLRRKGNTLNILAASALVLLLINPFLLFGIGFQLSYMAVFSIVCLQPFIYRLFDFQHPVADYLWKLIALSVSAQAGTFPLALLYFNQFPNYFILTNIVVVPLAALILYLAMAIVIAGWVPFLGSALVWLLNGSLKAMIFSVSTIEQLPGSVFRSIRFSPEQAAWLYLVTILFILFVAFRNRKFLLAALTGIALFMAWIVILETETLHTGSFTVFNREGNSVMMLTQGTKAAVIFAGKNIRDARQAEILSKPLALHLGIRAKSFVCRDTLVPGKEYDLQGIKCCAGHGNVLLLRSSMGRIAAVYGKPLLTSADTAGIAVDFLVLGRGSASSFKQLGRQTGAKTVILDSSCTATDYSGDSEGEFSSQNTVFEVCTKGAFFISKHAIMAP